MKILFIHPYYSCGGVEKGINILSDGLSQSGHTAGLYFIRSTIDPRELKFQCLHQSNAPRISQSSIDIFRIVVDHKYDAIVLNQSYVIAAIAIPLFFLAKLYNTPLKVISFERLNPEAYFSRPYFFRSIKRKLYAFALLCSDLILSNSLEQVLDYSEKYPHKVIRYIPNSSYQNPHTNTIDFDAFQTSALSKTILWVGRLSSVKRPLLAIQCVQSLGPDWSLHIYGSGPKAAECQQYILENGLSQQVSLRQQAQNTDVAYCCYLSTSLYEGLPNTFLEALKNRIPIVTTTFRSGALELFIPYWVYPVFKPSPEHLANTVKKLTRDLDASLRNQVPLTPLVKNFYSKRSMIDAFECAIAAVCS